MKLDLLTNATVVDDAIRFVTEKSECKEQVKSSCSDNGNEGAKESKDPDYGDDEKSDKVGEDKQERDTGELTMIPTTNQVF